MSQFFTLAELVAKANELLALGPFKPVTSRTIRAYITKRILPVAHRRGKGAYYSELHLREIVLMRIAQARGLRAYGYTRWRLPQDIAKLESLQRALKAVDGNTGSTHSATSDLPQPIEPALPHSGSLEGPAEHINSSGKPIDGLSDEQRDNALSSPAQSVIPISTKEVTIEEPPRARAEGWQSWEIAPGLRIWVRDDVFVSWSQVEESAVLTFVNQLRFSSSSN